MADRPAGIPTLETQRLILRGFRADDAPEVQRLAGDWKIAATTASIPHPYGDGVAEAWIGAHARAFEDGDAAHFAVVLKPGSPLLGACGLAVHREYRMAELGYWIGAPYWGRGYCTEAAATVVRFGFEVMGLNRIFARHMMKNPASGRVLQKIGMAHEGTLRQSIFRWGSYEDAAVYAILQEEFRAPSSGGPAASGKDSSTRV